MSLGTSRSSLRTKRAVMDTTIRQIENRFSKERITFLQTGAETGGELFAFEVRVPTDMVSPPPHLHVAEEERLEVLEGEITVQAYGRQHVLRPGESQGLPTRGGTRARNPSASAASSGRRGTRRASSRPTAALPPRVTPTRKGSPRSFRSRRRCPSGACTWPVPRSWLNVCSWPCYGRWPDYADTARVTSGSSRVHNTF